MREIEEGDESGPASGDPASELSRIVTLLRERTGHDFAGYKRNTFQRRVERRMQVTGCTTEADYAAYIEGHGAEATALLDDLLIGVTAFFRDKTEFEALEREVIPKLFAGKGTSDDVRVWVLGCATGEEAYSVAMLLREHMGTLDAPPRAQIFATDIDGRALDAARRGRYPESISADLTRERLDRWFDQDADGYTIARELRDLCVFSQHSLLKDAPFSRLDLITCRNLLIYLTLDLQNRVVPLLHFALRRGGFLFLGNSETIARRPRLFDAIDRRSRIYARVDHVTGKLPEFPLGLGGRIQPANLPKKADISTLGSLARRAERIAERYAPAYVIVDISQDVLHFHGPTGRYLEPANGEATLNILSLVHRDLRPDLRLLLHRAMTERKPIWADRIKLDTNGETLLVRLSVEPVVDGTGMAFMVLFQDRDILPEGPEGLPSAESGPNAHLEQLEDELRITGQQLQGMLEELEATNQELKSSNEEYQSINEELQSANEELETSKEELQSVNEELQSVNSELARRVSEVDQANSDLKNLLESTEIATAFLDNDLRIRNFTPALANIFRLIDSDVGRSILDLASLVDYPDMADDVRSVLRTLATVEREVNAADGTAQYLARVLPYRSLDNVIGGAVLTFLDISAIARAERALHEADERFRNIARSAPAFLFFGTKELDWAYINPPFLIYSGMQEAEARGEGWLLAVHPDDLPKLRAVSRRAAKAKTVMEIEYRLRAASGDYRWFLSRAEPQLGENGQIVRWYGSCTDVDDQHANEVRLRMLMGELQHRVKNILAVVRSIFSRTVETSESLEDTSAHFQGRLDALARTQSVLVRTADGSVDLETMIRDELTHFDGMAGKVSVAGPALKLRAASAETMGLLIHELATNSAKYGALAQAKGHVSVSWRIAPVGGGPQLKWEWRETGVTVLDPAPKRTGFGRELIESGVPYQLGAVTKLDFNPGGIRCSIELLLNERVAVIEDLSAK